MLVIVLAIIIALILLPFALALAADILTILPFAIVGAIGVLIIGAIGAFIKFKIIDKVPEETKRKIMYTLEYVLLAVAAYYMISSFKGNYSIRTLSAILPIVLLCLTFTSMITNKPTLAKILSIIAFIQSILMALGVSFFSVSIFRSNNVLSNLRHNLPYVTYIISLIELMVYNFGNKAKWDKNTSAGWAFLWLLSVIVVIVIAYTNVKVFLDLRVIYLGACSIFGLIVVSFFPPQIEDKQQ